MKNLPCPVGYACFYQDANGQGSMLETQLGIPNLTAVGFNDQMTSWINNLSVTFCWYTDANWNGVEHSMPPRLNFPHNVLPVENDTASSVGYC